MLKRINRALRAYLLVEPHHLNAPDTATWKMSVVRLVVLSGLLLTSAILLHSSYQAYTLNLHHVLLLTVTFTGLLWGALVISKSRIGMATALLTLIIVLAGLCILLFTGDAQSARYGLLFFFSLPIILRLFYGTKVAVIGMVLNVIPYIILLGNQPIPPLLGLDITMPRTHIYLSSLVFLFFNFCLPVAVMRVLASLEKQSEINREQRRKLGQLVMQYQEIFNNGGTPSFFCDQQGRIIQANRGGRALMQGDSRNSRYLQDLFELEQPLDDSETVTTRLRSNHDALFQIQPASLQHHKRRLIHCFDVSERLAADKAIDKLKRQHLNQYYSDTLTELKNHHYWSHQFAQRPSRDFTVVLLKLDNLKDINLQYGFARGDEVMSDVAALLQNQMPTGADLYRYPGAKFILTVDDCQCTQDDMASWLERYMPLTLIQRQQQQRLIFNLHWRAGYCHAAGNSSAAGLAEACAIALTQTDAQFPFSAYDSKIVKLIRNDTKQRDTVRQLLDDGHLSMWLQPQVDANQQLIGYEVLARLHDPEANRTMQPNEFLPQIERHNWHVLFSHKVLDKSVELLENWPKSLKPVALSVNLSGPELLDDLFYEKLLRRYSESELLRTRLKLELTETSVLASLDETKKRLTSLANVGATIIVDDFGTGHASLSQLIDLSASVLKVDRDFVERIETSERHRKIVKMTLELANSLDMEALAEGVETKAQLDLLVAMGFNQFQGFYFGKPAPVEYWSGKFEQASASSALGQGGAG